MIFNKDKNGAEELRSLTGNYYANNDFSKMKADIETATDELARVIGRDTYLAAEREYLSGNPSDLVTLVQRPIALLATLSMYRKNDISHEDSGRKVKTASDGTDRIPWEWQLDRDDAIHLEEYYRAVERLIRYLDDNEVDTWMNSDQKKTASALLIRSGREFDKYFPIQSSERMYMLLVGFIREAQIRHVKPAYGGQWDDLLNDKGIPETEVHFAACKAVALLSMAIALRRLPLQLIPQGIIRSYMAENGARASLPASLEDVNKLSDWLVQDATDWVAQMKDIRDGRVGDISILPENDPRNKYFRL